MNLDFVFETYFCIFTWKKWLSKVVLENLNFRLTLQLHRNIVSDFEPTHFQQKAQNMMTTLHYSWWLFRFLVLPYFTALRSSVQSHLSAETLFKNLVQFSTSKTQSCSLLESIDTVVRAYTMQQPFISHDGVSFHRDVNWHEHTYLPPSLPKNSIRNRSNSLTVFRTISSILTVQAFVV